MKLWFRSHFQAFYEIAGIMARHKQLIWEMTKREISDRYAGQVFGALWAIGHPLVLMCIYVFVFGFVFKVRVSEGGGAPLDYTTYLLSGLIPWMAFQESMNKGSTVIVSNANLVKQVVFPTEILPVKVVIASFLTQLIFTVLLIAYVIVTHGALSFSYALIPVLFFFQILAMIGVSYILSAIGVYFRDIKDFVQIFCTAGMYVMPIFYLPEMVPRLFRPVLYFNPFSYLIWCAQDIFYFGAIKHPWSWIIFCAGSAVIFYAGYRIFRKLKVMFGNML